MFLPIFKGAQRGTWIHISHNILNLLQRLTEAEKGANDIPDNNIVQSRLTSCLTLTRWDMTDGRRNL